MKYFTCGKVEIPLALITGVSWTVSARTTQKTGGYERALGKESVSISVRAVFNYAVCEAMEMSEGEISSLYNRLTSLATDCLDEPSRLIVGDMEPVPTLEFALTSCNKTQTYDPLFDPTMEFDMTFSGVRCVKEMARKETLTNVETSGQLPDVSISRGGRTLNIRDSYTIDRLVVRQSSVDIGLTVRDDLTVISRDGFLTDLCDGTATVTVQDRVYSIIAANIESNHVEISGSFWPVQSQKPFMKTYVDTTLKALFNELCERAGIKADIRVDGEVSYYLNSASPMDSLAALIVSCGAISLWREGKFMIVDAPDSIEAEVILDARVDAGNDASERITSCTWSDGLTSQMAGNTKGRGISVSSVYSGEARARQCLAQARFLQNSIVVECPIALGIEQGSAVRVQIADSMVSGIVTQFEADYLTWRATYYVSYIEGIENED